MLISKSELEDIARGAALLGTGGGGDPYIGLMLAKQAIEEFGMPQIIEPDDLDDDAFIITIAMLGAPSVLNEKGACGEDVDLAIRNLERRLGRKADALMPIEIGGVNSMLPIMAASRLGLPLVNADGMGRAFPEIQMVTFNVYGISCTPACVTDEHLNSVVIDTGSAKRAEDIVRVSSIEMGCSVIMASYSLSGADVKAYGVHGTLTTAQKIGHSIANGRKSGEPVSSLISYLSETEHYKHSKVIFDGKIVDLKREVSNGFTMGHCSLASLNATEESLEIMFQNEFLVAKKNGVTRAVVPDLICVVDRETAEAIPVDSLKYGQRVKVIGISAAPIMRTNESLAVFGPRAFGLNEDFVPLEEL